MEQLTTHCVATMLLAMLYHLGVGGTHNISVIDLLLQRYQDVIAMLVKEGDLLFLTVQHNPHVASQGSAATPVLPRPYTWNGMQIGSNRNATNHDPKLILRSHLQQVPATSNQSDAKDTSLVLRT